MVNPTIYVSCIKQFWALVSIKKSNDVVKLQALIDRKKVIITEDTIRQALRLDDADGIDFLPNEEIFAELARMGYEKPTAWNEFSSSMASAFICLATEEDKDDNEVSTASTPPSPTSAITPPSPQQEPIPSPPQAQPAQPSSPLHHQPTQPTASSESSMTLLNTLMETSQRVESSNDTVMNDQEDTSKQGGIAKLDADEDVTLVDVNADTHGRMEEDVTAIKDINAAESEPTVFDNEEMAKRLQYEEIEQVATRER
nr:hypothetical protein [Tanacetum cinerariifolium]